MSEQVSTIIINRVTTMGGNVTGRLLKKTVRSLARQTPDCFHAKVIKSSTDWKSDVPDYHDVEAAMV